MPNLIMRASGEASNGGGFVTGTYTGNGTANGNNQTITLGFTPSALLVVHRVNPSAGSTGIPIVYLAIPDSPQGLGGNANSVVIVNNGFTVAYVQSQSVQNANVNTAVYNYIAFK